MCDNIPKHKTHFLNFIQTSDKTLKKFLYEHFPQNISDELFELTGDAVFLFLLGRPLSTMNTENQLILSKIAFIYLAQVGLL